MKSIKEQIVAAAGNMTLDARQQGNARTPAVLGELRDAAAGRVYTVTPRDEPVNLRLERGDGQTLSFQFAEDTRGRVYCTGDEGIGRLVFGNGTACDFARVVGEFMQGLDVPTIG